MGLHDNLAQLDALRLADALRNRLVNFSLDNHFTRDSRLTEACRALWSGSPDCGGLVSELWVEGAFPAELATATLDTLVEAGRFNPELRDQLERTGTMPGARRLYTHQLEAIAGAAKASPSGAQPGLLV